MNNSIVSLLLIQIVLIECRVCQCRAERIVCKRIEDQSSCRAWKQKSEAIEKALKRTR